MKIFRQKKREGLIKARIRGTLEAKAEVLTFLDSHIEATEGWLEALLEKVAQNSTAVVCPVIDIIDDKTFEFKLLTYNYQVGGFDWRLNFDWHLPDEYELESRKDPSEPIKTPTMAGFY